MPWSVAAAVGGSLVSSALSPSGGGGGGGGGGGPQYYVPTGLSAADTAWQQLLTGQLGAYNAGNPYAGGYQQAANTAGAQSALLGPQANYYGGALGYYGNQAFGAGQALQQAGQNVYNLGLDPQSALYNRTAQQLTDQVNAGQALRGLGNSAVGGSEYNQAISNFNIDWQNQQLQRAATGAQALGSLYGQAGSYNQLGNQLYNASQGMYERTPGYTLQSGQTPYQTANTITNNQLGQAQSIQGTTIPYMNYGQGAQQQGYLNQAQSAGAAGALANQGISGLGNAFGNLFGSGGGGGFGYSGMGSLFGGGDSSFGSAGYGISPVTGFASGTNYSIPSFGFG